MLDADLAFAMSLVLFSIGTILGYVLGVQNRRKP